MNKSALALSNVSDYSFGDPSPGLIWGRIENLLYIIIPRPISKLVLKVLILQLNKKRSAVFILKIAFEALTCWCLKLGEFQP